MKSPSHILHALAAIVGFAAGGSAIVLVFAAMTGGSPNQTPAIVEEVWTNGRIGAAPPSAQGGNDPERTPGELSSSSAPRPLPVPGDTLRRLPHAGRIGPDSLAALMEALGERKLDLPLEDIEREDLRNDYDDPRPGGRPHEALDILAPRGTTVRAVEDGTIASLDPSQGGGGIVVYQYDPSGEFVYYYAHLERRAEGLAEGQAVERGDVIGYVGSSGNAPPDAPHLHFAIHKTPVAFRWWKGIPLNPYLLLH